MTEVYYCVSVVLMSLEGISRGVIETSAGPLGSPSTETLVYNKDQLLPNQPFPPPIFLDCANQLCSIIPFVVEVIGHQKCVHR